MIANGAGLALAPDHAKKGETAVDPPAQDERVVPMTSGNDEAQSARDSERFLEHFLPVAHAQRDVRRKELVISQGGAVIKNGDSKIETQRERRYGLCDVTGPGNPERAGGRDGFAVTPILRHGMRFVCPRDLKILRQAPDALALAPGEVCPDGRSGVNARKDDPKDATAANQAVVPAKIVIKDKIESLGFSGEQRLPGAVLDFGLETATAHGPDDTSIAIEERLGPNLLRTGALDLRNNAQRERFVTLGGSGQRFVEGGHSFRLAMKWGRAKNDHFPLRHPELVE